MQLEHTIIIFDLEAACKENDRSFDNEIIEIGAVKISPTLELTDEFTTFVQPVANPKLTPFCTELTTITQAEVDRAPRFPKLFNIFAIGSVKNPSCCCLGVLTTANKSRKTAHAGGWMPIGRPGVISISSSFMRNRYSASKSRSVWARL